MEKRQLTITINEARKWYKKGGDLREVALQVFTEDELYPRPKTWEEFCENYPVKTGECWVGHQDIIFENNTKYNPRTYKNWLPSYESAKAHIALNQLEQLRDCWRRDNIPDFTDNTKTKYCIKLVNNELSIVKVLGCQHSFLSFVDHKTTKEFLECFRPLIEIAKYYI
jgi:hypothetical protein